MFRIWSSTALILSLFVAAFTATTVYAQLGDTQTASGVINVAVSTSPNQLPDCSNAAPSESILWPPNHQFVAVEVVGVTDPDGDPITITIDSIHQDQAVDAKGSGKTSPDGQGVGTPTAEVRAERVGRGNGRVYHISFTADDGNGGSCTGEVLVSVPKSQGKKGVFDSTVVP